MFRLTNRRDDEKISGLVRSLLSEAGEKIHRWNNSIPVQFAIFGIVFLRDRLMENKTVLMNSCLMLIMALTAATPEKAALEWIDRFAYTAPESAGEGIASPGGASLPSFTVTPAETGLQMVRVSLPFAGGALPVGMGLAVIAEGSESSIAPDLRVLTLHPGLPRSVRRALLTFPFTFEDKTSRAFTLRLSRKPGPLAEPAQRNGIYQSVFGGYEITLDETGLRLAQNGKEVCRAMLIAPGRTLSVPPVVEIVEEGKHWRWVRVLVADTAWPRIVELRMDAQGRVWLRVHLQRLEQGIGYSPDFGWRLDGLSIAEAIVGGAAQEVAGAVFEHDFKEGVPCRLDAPECSVHIPLGVYERRGTVKAVAGSIEYHRAREGGGLPHQEAAWRTATLHITPHGGPSWTPEGETPHTVHISTGDFTSLYDIAPPRDLTPWPALEKARRTHWEAMASATLLGDDFGMINNMPNSGVFGMNRLNHCTPIFHAYYESGDMGLRAAALRWCENYHDLSIWWGLRRPSGFGGTRYNNRAAQGDGFEQDPAFMWRSDDAVTFCTKGIDALFYAFEETGDPRMATALRWQTDYARRMVHANTGEARNIGDVADFLRLYEFTGLPVHLDKALELFRELRTKLSEGDLFSQGGEPIVLDPPFIDDDKKGYAHPFAKPYILGYALAGLPRLLRYAPDELQLREVVQAVADFMVEAQDPLGGWRYPHPRSSYLIIDQGMEHAAQLVNAARALEAAGHPINRQLDAIEKVLQARVNALQRKDLFLIGLEGWERATGAASTSEDLYARYQKPEDRDPAHDYEEGRIVTGNASPEGVVYFPYVLDWYLKHRPAERLFNATPPLARLLDRLDPEPVAKAIDTAYPGYGMAQHLPVFVEQRLARMTFPMAWRAEKDQDFTTWRSLARAKLLEYLLDAPPRANFDAAVTAREDRGKYEARKLVFNVSADSRIPAYLLVPKGAGPFPAVLALHDHGARFSIGKEKVVRPFGIDNTVMKDARGWVEECYGGRWIGDVLAERGFVVLAIDALFWGERGRREGVDYKAQQTLSANLLQLGMTWSGVITWDDIRSAEFLASLPEVDPARIGATGLSMGCHRTWMLCAASDLIAAGAAICWMGTTEALMAPGNNQTKGDSAYSMLVPNLRNCLDYPDVAAIACPKPMLFYNGEKDPLFPVPGVEAAYVRMRAVWESQEAGDRLETRLWPVPHVFNVEMQDTAFDWLQEQLTL